VKRQLLQRGQRCDRPQPGVADLQAARQVERAQRAWAARRERGADCGIGHEGERARITKHEPSKRRAAAGGEHGCEAAGVSGAAGEADECEALQPQAVPR
jgi:hypothetical protein